MRVLDNEVFIILLLQLKGCSLPDIIRRNTNIDGNPLRDIIIVIIGLSGLGKVIIVFGINFNIECVFWSSPWLALFLSVSFCQSCSSLLSESSSSRLTHPSGKKSVSRISS